MNSFYDKQINCSSDKTTNSASTNTEFFDANKILLKELQIGLFLIYFDSQVKIRFVQIKTSRTFCETNSLFLDAGLGVSSDDQVKR